MYDDEEKELNEDAPLDDEALRDMPELVDEEDSYDPGERGFN